MSAIELFEKYKIEINSHDFNRVEPLISRNCRFWFSSGTFHGLEQTRKAFEKTWATIQNEIYSITEVEWLSSNKESAACTYTYHWAGLINSQTREGKGRGTSCFRVEEGEWKIVHEHLSAFPAQA
ncbi:MAG: nuclear transport factor 2 family protein [Bdellovibrionaceae bacterium]|nr:nuclear transport factor 2 family protein [Pseudobdellovibrionaceae bacterium]